MSTAVTLEQVEALAAQLPLPEQLKLMSRLSRRLSEVTAGLPPGEGEESLRRRREQEADALVALCDAAAAMAGGASDSVEEIRQMRADRDEQTCPNKP